MTRGAPLLQVSGLSKRFGKAGPAGLRDIGFSLSRGETLAIAGASGSGKTTLAQLVLRLQEPDHGTIQLLGQDITRLGGEALRRMRPRFQMVFQDSMAAFNPRASVRRILEAPLRIHKLAAKGACEPIIIRMLEKVGLGAEHLDRLPRSLSGGQRQRVAIARAMLTQPQLLVLDEPVSALDLSIRAQILNLLLDLQEETGIAYLFISHDLAVINAVADRLIVLDEGRLVEEGATAAVLAAPQAEATRALIAAVPRLPPGGPG
ncbi:ATP-binding cassette domain-containing protein [Phyllobacterium sp. 21LDTY02-6]|uniref:ABC transporter ATP-binding protein n=1 Tax=unclassified Phyllobacterium TaxID=2638441 RepID=UPI0020227685|nr:MULTISPECIES: ATP-binding cassette domain-containing protein [unclassified Phyllobacterium]MCO4318410.1 ATP-binding cassette domain-containing protein [Phyllobacterium sp. 21LDTY02-6]MCX8281330.1 ATP-binding cassette domain-containing protein [Phyllobacterium sp. 0TCS1.6C]MCX8296014.1 ATP-binding cassette domain-containing protein [Phyllobacterium sp. 0TCS1.6A]